MLVIRTCSTSRISIVSVVVVSHREVIIVLCFLLGHELFLLHLLLQHEFFFSCLFFSSHILDLHILERHSLHVLVLRLAFRVLVG